MKVVIVYRETMAYGGGSYISAEIVEAVFTDTALALKFIESRKTPHKFRSEVVEVFDSLDGATIFRPYPEVEICGE